MAVINIKELIIKNISDFCVEKQIESMWKPPLVSTIPANHTQLPLLKKAVSSDHLLPEDLLSDAKSVIVIFIPFDDRIAKSNTVGETASEEWVLAYIYTNELLNSLTKKLSMYLEDKGFRAEAIKATHNFNKETLISRWSHRHIAYLAGMGTFGINNMLITQNGCCGRFSSLITNADLNVFGFSINYDICRDEKCLYKKNGSCGLCHKKCPSNAYNKEGVFDRHACYKLCLVNAEIYKNYGIADICGKCLVGLPCSSKSPV